MRMSICIIFVKIFIVCLYVYVDTHTFIYDKFLDVLYYIYILHIYYMYVYI